MIQDLCKRFPLLGEMVFENLDDESLVKVKESSKEKNNHIQNQRFYWIRIIKKHGKYFKEFADSWKKVIDKTPVEIVKELAMTVEDYFNYSLYNDDDYQLHPLHIAAETGEVDTCRLIMKYVRHRNPPSADRVTPLHRAVCFKVA